MRVLGERNWARPGKMRAGYDAWVLGMHAAHVGVCTGAQVCRGQGKRLGSHGAAHLDFYQSIATTSINEAESQLESRPVETAPFCT